MYIYLLRDLENSLSSYDEWPLVSYYIRKADDLGKTGKDSEEREALLDAIAVATANGQKNAAIKISKYLGFY